MKKLFGWLALLRPFNLTLLSITPLCLWIALVLPLLEVPQLNDTQVLMLGMAIALVAGAGNIVNDIADRTIDELNNRKNPLLAAVSVAEAWILYALLNAGALLISIYLAQQLGWWGALILLPLAILLLLAYSFYLKCTPVLGNLLVALLCAGVPGIILYAEPALLQELPSSANAHAMLGYIVFAFGGTLMRETIKDLEDRAGDAAAGCRTLAVIWPKSQVHWFSHGCGFVAMLALAHVSMVQWRSGFTSAAIGWLAVWGWMALTMYRVDKEQKDLREHYSFISSQLKWILVLALLLLILYSRESWGRVTI